MYKKKLVELGIPPNIKGFEYLNAAMIEYVPTKTSLSNLYEKIANEYDNSSMSVNRCIRYAISFSREKLSTGEFIAKYKIFWR